MTLDPVAVADWLQRAGVVGLLVFILLGGARKLWVFGYQLDEMRTDRDLWREIALKGIAHAGRSVDVGTKAVELVVQQRKATE